MSSPAKPQEATVFGHPAGLYTLFFAEMWERFSFYGMRALLILYMVKGFLKYGDSDAISIYGAYTSLVYMTPFFGGILADRLLGARRAVVVGGLLMAAGQLLLTVPDKLSFFTGLAFLICGNGFFKPNISTIVGSLYAKQPAKRDGGFTIFYVGINLGATMSPLLCGYIGETYDMAYGFGLATIGMLIGIAVFVAPTRLTQVLIAGGALATTVALLRYHPNNAISITTNVLVAVALLVSAGVAWLALERGGIPTDAGAPPNPALLRKPVWGRITMLGAMYLGTLAAIAGFVLLVSGFAVFTSTPVTLIPDSFVESLQASDSAFQRGMAEIVKEVGRPAGMVLALAGIAALVFIAREIVRLGKIARERMYVVMILTFFSMMFWAFFEQAGSSVNNFTDRNIDRVLQQRTIAAADVGQKIMLRVSEETDDPELAKLPLLSQEQVGRRNGNPGMKPWIEKVIRAQEAEKKSLKPEKVDELVRYAREYPVLTLTELTYLRDAAKEENASTEQRRLEWTVTEDNIGMGIGGSEIPASQFQAVNPFCILLLGLVFTALWTFLGNRGLEPSTTVKFALGLVQLSLGFAIFWFAAYSADPRGMCFASWLVLGYVVQTTGELCLSPVGLAMVTRLSPARLVSTVMGIWFLATAFSQWLAAIIAQFTSVTKGSLIPPPSETVAIYGNVFGGIAIASMGIAALCFALVPLLNKWMHEDHPETE
jgi:POT family proton-dependent oligopeptide transporter